MVDITANINIEDVDTITELDQDFDDMLFFICHKVRLLRQKQKAVDAFIETKFLDMLFKKTSPSFHPYKTIKPTAIIRDINKFII